MCRMFFASLLHHLLCQHPQPPHLALRERLYRQRELEEVAQPKEEIRGYLRCALMLPTGYNTVAQVYLFALQPRTDSGILRRKPGEVASHRQLVQATTCVALGCCQLLPIYIVF